MGVSVPAGAALVCYVPLDPVEDFDNQIILPLQAALLLKYRSLTQADSLLGEGNRVIATNSRAYFGISTSDKLLAVWAVPKAKNDLAEGWVASIEKSFLALVVDTFGSFYRKA